MPTPEHRIIWELERLPARERMGTLVQVMQRLGMTTPARPGAFSRSGIGLLAMGAVALGLATGMLVWRNTQYARLALTTDPADAMVLVDGQAVHEPKMAIIRRPGPHTLTVSRAGYLRSDQKIVLSADEPLPVHVHLEPSPDTGFEITSEPSGTAIWLDGEQVGDATGSLRHTPFRMGRVAPGRHLLEVTEVAAIHHPWRGVIVIEPDRYTVVHALLAAVEPPCTL